ncbi:MFS transporter [Staphylococcus schweitzeri]|uniref:Integral membrane protein n=1 Tax=Staphylococcus schweitzeri TaxID=1654388 RepID=A0A2K4AMJ8_9STAP|nr:MFS transporter [Staphylococcus schweitzeri]MBE2127730.1 MFS transporter [Staphylococcus schweitzeri]PNZ51310.1 MFS transporter [Staphylococcus schweitzeri]CDR26956.1 integral membrane protein [Staphylococcus schweitzeri]CDR50805.1 integral membrane protein [Staphylococcus schweitzeri]CDR53281.1 integral membrane protein [Staphylococcus schweitzeri]
MKRLSTTLKVRLISNFLQLIITTAFIPFIALYLTDMLSQSIVGIYLVGLVVLKFPLSIISGYLIEIFPKKLLVLIYQATMVIMLVLMGIFESHQLWQIIGFCVSYAIFTIVWGLQFPVMDTLIMDAITEDVEHFIYKISYWITNLSVAIGALLGGLMYGHSMLLLFLIAACIFLFVLIILYIWLPQDQNQVRQSDDNRYASSYRKLQIMNIFRSYKLVLKDCNYMLLISGFSIIMMGEFSISSYIAIRLKDQFETISIGSYDITGAKMLAILLMINTVCVILLTYFISKVVLKMDFKIALIIGLLIYIVGYSSLTYLNQFGLLVVFMIVATVGEIIYSPIVSEQRFKIIPRAKRGTYSAVNALGIHISETLARLGIVLGTFLTSLQMGLYMFIVLTIGASMLVAGVFGGQKQSNTD